MTDDPGSGFSTVWNAVVSELNGDPNADGIAANGTTLTAPLTPQQRAWLNLVQPLTIVEGFALLSVPSSFVQNEIERHLRTPITDALSRRLGQEIQLGIAVSLPRRPTTPTTAPLPYILSSCILHRSWIPVLSPPGKNSGSDGDVRFQIESD